MSFSAEISQSQQELNWSISSQLKYTWATFNYAKEIIPFDMDASKTPHFGITWYAYTIGMPSFYNQSRFSDWLISEFQILIFSKSEFMFFSGSNHFTPLMYEFNNLGTITIYSEEVNCFGRLVLGTSRPIRETEYFSYFSHI